jgi:hypothetical protein
MRKEKLIVLGIALFAIFTSEGQERNCGTNIDLAWLQANAPDRYQRVINLENFTANYIANQR